MGFLAPAVPWMIKGGAMLGGALFGKHAQSSAAKLSPMEQTGAGGIQSSATGLTQAGQGLYGAGLPAAQQATGYWSTLLRGNRAAMAQATAAPRAAITDQARGSELSLERSGVRGAVKDLAKGQIARDTGSQIAGLTSGVQPAAASALGELGTTLTGQGTQAMGTAGNLWGNLLGTGFAQRKYAREEGAQAGQQVGSLLYDLLTGTIGKNKAGGGNLPSSPLPGGNVQWQMPGGFSWASLAGG